jgi:hypothetical protein
MDTLVDMDLDLHLSVLISRLPDFGLQTNNGRFLLPADDTADDIILPGTGVPRYGYYGYFQVVA